MSNTLPNKAEREALNNDSGKVFSMYWRFDLISLRRIPYLLALPPSTIYNTSSSCIARR